MRAALEVVVVQWEAVDLGDREERGEPFVCSRGSLSGYAALRSANGKEVANPRPAPRPPRSDISLALQN